jgi:hypothetical protein
MHTMDGLNTGTQNLKKYRFFNRIWIEWGFLEGLTPVFSLILYVMESLICNSLHSTPNRAREWYEGPGL